MAQPVIDPGDCKRYIDTLIERVCSPNETRAPAILRYLLKRWTDANGSTHEVRWEEISKNVSGGTMKQGTVTTNITRVWERIKKFHESKEFKSKTIRVYPRRAITENYSLIFVPKEESAPEIREVPTGKFVRTFWEPYLKDHPPARLYYPEPLFFCEREHGTFLRNINVNLPKDLKKLKSLIGDREVRESHPYVPVGIVSALLELFWFFAKNGVIIEACPFHLGSGIKLSNARENIIVFGTAATLKMVSNLEGTVTLVTERGTKPLALRPNHSRRDQSGYSEPALITRWPHPRGRDADRRYFIMVINSAHGRAVEAIVRSLFDDFHLQTLAGKLNCKDGVFPNYFQADCNVIMGLDSYDDPDPGQVDLVDQVCLKRGKAI